jgi:hypothetical protein
MNEDNCEREHPHVKQLGALVVTDLENGAAGGCRAMIPAPKLNSGWC